MRQTENKVVKAINALKLQKSHRWRISVADTAKFAFFECLKAFLSFWKFIL